ncbi:hypothetical protein B0H99_1303, partial [Planomicrobium soli]
NENLQKSQMERKAATPAGPARAEDPGQSEAKGAAEAVPAESVRLERNEKSCREFLDSLKKLVQGTPWTSFLLTPTTLQLF